MDSASGNPGKQKTKKNESKDVKISSIAKEPNDNSIYEVRTK
jgi:hypothetical protein